MKKKSAPVSNLAEFRYKKWTGEKHAWGAWMPTRLEEVFPAGPEKQSERPQKPKTGRPRKVAHDKNAIPAVVYEVLNYMKWRPEMHASAIAICESFVADGRMNKRVSRDGRVITYRPVIQVEGATPPGGKA